MTGLSKLKNGEAVRSVEEEPPGAVDSEEPPGKTYFLNRAKYFGGVPEAAWNDWKWQFRNRITNVNQLARFIPLSSVEHARLRLVTSKYPLSITPYYLCLIDFSNSNDPIWKQSIPSFQEISYPDMGMDDPLGEMRDSVVPGLVHRYPDRVLMVLTDICPMFCRHCTRKREWRGGNWVHTPDEIDRMLDYIRRNKAVRDVIISGGDPLSLSTKRLEYVISRLRQISHVEIIRIGSRYPVVLPQRIDDELCEMISKYGPIWLNTHFNNVREITPESAAACDRILRSGVPVNNQAVLLKGVNDSVDEQMCLTHGLLKIKVRPYYLYQCDEVSGTEHLRTSIDEGLKIIEGMRGHTSGLAVPTFVIDLPSGGGKVPLQPDYVLLHTQRELVLTNYEGRIFRYRNPSDTLKNNRRNGKHAERQVASNGEGVGHKIQMPKVADENRAIVRS